MRAQNILCLFPFPKKSFEGDKHSWTRDGDSRVCLISSAFTFLLRLVCVRECPTLLWIGTWLMIGRLHLKGNDKHTHTLKPWRIHCNKSFLRFTSKRLDKDVLHPEIWVAWEIRWDEVSHDGKWIWDFYLICGSKGSFRLTCTRIDWLVVGPVISYT